MISMLAMTAALGIGVPMVLDPGNPPTIAYWARHPLHTIAGVSHLAEGSAQVMSDGSSEVQVRVPLDSFASGRSSADRSLLETFNGLAFPTVEVKAIVPPHPRPALSPDGTGIEDVAAHFLVTLHGVSQRMNGRVWIFYQFDSTISVSGDVAFDLNDFGLQAPTFLFLAINHIIPVHFDLSWRAQPGILPPLATLNGSAWLKPEAIPRPEGQAPVPNIDHIEFLAPTK